MNTVSLNLRKCKINGDMCGISIRNHKDNTVKQLKFDTDNEAYSKYLELTENKIPVKIVTPKPSHNESGVKDEDIKKYVLENLDLKGVKSARHLNNKFKVKLKQAYYNELLKGL